MCFLSELAKPFLQTCFTLGLECVTFKTIKIALKVELLRFFFSPIASPLFAKRQTNIYILQFHVLKRLPRQSLNKSVFHCLGKGAKKSGKSVVFDQTHSDPPHFWPPGGGIQKNGKKDLLKICFRHYQSIFHKKNEKKITVKMTKPGSGEGFGRFWSKTRLFPDFFCYLRPSL